METPISKMTMQQVPKSIYHYFILYQDSIAEWFALSHLDSSVDTNSITVQMLHRYISHLGGKADKATSQAKTGSKASAESKAKMSQARTGHKLSAETKAKIQDEPSEDGAHGL
jgi:hypothetical protein